MIPLRSEHERMSFCDAYFSAVGAMLAYSSEGYREYTLPLDIDKELTDRPFFWMWAEKTGQEIQPTTLRLAFTQDALNRENARLKEAALLDAERKNLTQVERMFFRAPTAELINLGSFRLNKIQNSVGKHGQFTSVMPLHANNHVIIVPWLSLNGIISFRCDSVQQEWYSIGVCLQNGQIIERFYDTIRHIPMKYTEPNRLLKTTSISLHEAFARAKHHVERIAEKRPHNWAHEASDRLITELKQIDTYYQSLNCDVPEAEQNVLRAEQARKKRELEELITPKIEVDWRQIALVGLLEK